MGHKQDQRILADKGDGTVFTQGWTGEERIEVSAKVVERNDSAIGKQRPQQVISGEKDVAVMSHDGRAPQQKRQIAYQTDGKQLFVRFVPAQTVAYHEKGDTHRYVRDIKGQRIIQPVESKTYGNADDDCCNRRYGPPYQETRDDADKKQRQDEPRGDIDQDIPIDGKSIQNIDNGTMPREIPVYR